METLDRDSLDALYVAGQDYAIIAWNISPEIIPDGSYELRTVVGCSGDDHDGVSEVVEGIIDRTGPDVLGLPSPTDGVLNLGDAISIEFNEEIDAKRSLCRTLTLRCRTHGQDSGWTLSTPVAITV